MTVIYLLVKGSQSTNLTESSRAAPNHRTQPEHPHRGEGAPDEGLAQGEGRVDCPLVGHQSGHVSHSNGDGGVEVPVRLFRVLVSDSQIGEDDHEGEEELQTELSHADVLIPRYFRCAEKSKDHGGPGDCSARLSQDVGECSERRDSLDDGGREGEGGIDVGPGHGEEDGGEGRGGETSHQAAVDLTGPGMTVSTGDAHQADQQGVEESGDTLGSQGPPERESTNQRNEINFIMSCKNF